MTGLADLGRGEYVAAGMAPIATVRRRVSLLKAVGLRRVATQAAHDSACQFGRARAAYGNSHRVNWPRVGRWRPHKP
jgi:hypothetical protein